MQIIDAFRFPICNPIENELLDSNNFKFESNDRYGNNLENIWVNFDLSKRSEVNLLNGQEHNWIWGLSSDNDFIERQKKSIRLNHIKAYVLHPYMQNITPPTYSSYLDVCRQVEDLGVPLVICTAFGSKKMYKIKPLEFAAYIASNISSPIVLSHCGGAKIIEAMLLAEAYENIILDTSFTLSYWKNSSIEIDLAFAFKKLGPHKVMFGSDAPFVNQDVAIQDCLNFLEKNDFSDNDIESIFYWNAKNVYRL